MSNREKELRSQGYLPAVMTGETRGKFTQWKTGERVWAMRRRGQKFFDLHKWKERKPCDLPLLCSMIGCSVKLVKFL